MENNLGNTTQQNKKSGLTKMISAIVVIAIAAFAWFKMNDEQNPGNGYQNRGEDAGAGTGQGMMNQGEGMMANRKYRNGAYTATGMYQSPAGTENVEIAVVIKDDVITSGTFVGKAIHPTSIKLQALFSAGFNSYVVGKKVDDIQVMAVNGSSLTPKGFMDALVKIKAQAEA